MIRMESADARLARIEEKLDGLDKRLSERCSGCFSRIEALEKSNIRLGERVGKLEATHHREAGGWLIISKFIAAGGVIGGLLVKCWEWLAK